MEFLPFVDQNSDFQSLTACYISVGKIGRMKIELMSGNDWKHIELSWNKIFQQQIPSLSKNQRWKGRKMHSLSKKAYIVKKNKNCGNLS